VVKAHDAPAVTKQSGVVPPASGTRSDRPAR
jgi:hypothetical protein